VLFIFAPLTFCSGGGRTHHDPKKAKVDRDIYIYHSGTIEEGVLIGLAGI